MKRGTPDHPKTLMLTIELEKIYRAHKKKSAFGGKAEAVGILEVLWEWCSKYAIQGDIGKWPDDVIAAGIGWHFSGEELISALIRSKWLDIVAEPNRLVIHDIKDHAQNHWRQNLQNAGLTWWDGSPPRKYNLEKSPKQVQNKSKVWTQTETETETETEPKTLSASSRARGVETTTADSTPINIKNSTPHLPSCMLRYPLGSHSSIAEEMAWIGQAMYDYVLGKFGQPDEAICQQALLAANGATREEIAEYLVTCHRAGKQPAKSYGYLVGLLRQHFGGLRTA